MEAYSIFDVIGPIMIGPSSSHTAGAAKIAYIAHQKLGEDVKKAVFLLHGSFAKTYKGHGTDKALVGGILGISHEDVLLKEALTIAKKKNVSIEFKEVDFGNVHPNTVQIILTSIKGKVISIMGSSIGAGKIEILSKEAIH
ncbi:iron-sulfur-dependent L-serine dehydratase beta subunit [Natranaerovirga hydrolytica]|uniref:L-serine dehydratase n=1 Tax=Natranaerovirga hydrolytica TaxID=680378 RepID=A0A4R1N3L1_9FIRM|nr:L-serine ammonia-lyase, iron-sulfur-dependent subunit beta [Natranaerovirga hydrolytica]TCL00044.1 iron-sulfur-dependent L-serine dehydratase beta subunit [Natranaerovirga hydrolytica]